MIKIVGLGPGSKDALTIGTINELEASKHIFLRNRKASNSRLPEGKKYRI